MMKNNIGSTIAEMTVISVRVSSAAQTVDIELTHASKMFFMSFICLKSCEKFGISHPELLYNSFMKRHLLGVVNFFVAAMIGVLIDYGFFAFIHFIYSHPTFTSSASANTVLR